MDFELKYSPEQEAFRAEVKEWMQENVSQAFLEAANKEHTTYEEWTALREFGKKLGDKGWLRPMLAKEWGGGGLRGDNALIISEILEDYEIPFPPYHDPGAVGAIANLLRYGSDDQKERFLKPIVRGDAVTWLLLSEPEAGSDLASVKLRATKDGDDFVLNGQKMWVGASHGVDLLWTLCVTEPDAPRHQNLGFFMVPAQTPGITIMPLDLLPSGPGTGGPKNNVFFDNVRVPGANLVGARGDGWAMANAGLELERGGSPATRDRFRERLFSYASEALLVGKPLIQDADARDHLIDMWERTEIRRLLGVRNFWMRDAGRKLTYEISQTSYVGKMTGLWMGSPLLKAFGYAALISEPQLGALDGLAEMKARTGIVGVHPAGTADVQKTIVARRLGVGRSVQEEGF